MWKWKKKCSVVIANYYFLFYFWIICYRTSPLPAFKFSLKRKQSCWIFLNNCEILKRKKNKMKIFIIFIIDWFDLALKTILLTQMKINNFAFIVSCCFLLVIHLKKIYLIPFFIFFFCILIFFIYIYIYIIIDFYYLHMEMNFCVLFCFFFVPIIIKIFHFFILL